MRTPDRDAFREVFEAAGVYQADTAVGGRRRNRTGRDRVIVAVDIHREKAGTAGTTLVDVLIDGISIFAAPSNRPSVGFGDGADAEATYSLGASDTITWPAGSYMTMDVVTAEAGPRGNLTVVVTGE